MAYKDLEKRREWQKLYYSKNKDRLLERDRIYREKNRDKIRARCRASRKIYYKNNRAKELAYAKIYCKKNREKILIDNKAYRNSHKVALAESFKRWTEKNREKRAEYYKLYYQINKEKKLSSQRTYFTHRRKIDTNFKLRMNLASRVKAVLVGDSKSKSTIELLGCSINELRTWLESQFQDGMTWDNYGQWHVDHVYPCAKFNLEQPYEQKICFNWFNLQPLWAKDNLIKGNKINI